MATSSNTRPKDLTLRRYKRTNKSYTESLGNEVELTLMLIPAGEFVMGAPEEEEGSGNRERPQHPVKVNQFLMGRYAVTQAQWRVVAGYEAIARELNPDPSRFKGDNHPVEQVSWEAAQEFCQRLSRHSGKNYGLPSESQWEYACRAGMTTPFHYGPMITPGLANYNSNRSYNEGPTREPIGKTVEVGSYPANDWGLHDMHGNVWEWCEDDWHNSYEGAPEDGSPWIKSDRSNSHRVLRGGSWNYNPAICRSAVRNGVTRDFIDYFVGFRVSCEPPRTLPS